MDSSIGISEASLFEEEGWGQRKGSGIAKSLQNTKVAWHFPSKPKSKKEIENPVPLTYSCGIRVGSPYVPDTLVDAICFLNAFDWSI